MLSLDLRRSVFSRYGTDLAIGFVSPADLPEGLYLRRVFGGRSHTLYRLGVTRKGEPVPFEVLANPTRLRLISATGFVELCMPGAGLLRARGEGVGLRLERTTNHYGGVVEGSDGRFRSIVEDTKLMLSPLEGQLEVDAPWYPQQMWGTVHHRCDRIVFDAQPDRESGRFELMVERYESEWEPKSYATSFDEDVAASARSYGRWLAALPDVPPRYQQAKELAVYINWSCVVPAAGNFPEPAMLMSKVGMLNVWNWDNYFNAWAMCTIDPEFAWKSLFMLHFHHQHPQGALADDINERSLGFSYTKPPVHGWILARMMQKCPSIGIERLSQVYEPLCRWTRFWLAYRDDDRDGLCQYNHGNDSGWDNATIFDLYMPVESPDLSALLVKQMDCLADFAERLGRPEEASVWRSQADALLARLVEHFFVDGRLQARRSGTHELPPRGDSLLPHLAIILGSRLPEHVRKATIAALAEEGRFLTPYGLATESVRSELHVSNGYWRGPIWAPAMMMAIDGLNEAGEASLARELARRFCDLCQRSGFAENFEARTGDPLCDPAYTWTASVFLILVRDYLFC
jgi:hypothetical protein